MKIKIKLLILSNILAMLIWFGEAFSFNGNGGFSYDGSSLVFNFVVLIFLLYSSFYSYKLMNMDENNIVMERPKLSLMALLSAIPNFVATILYIVINDDLLNMQIKMNDEEKKAYLSKVEKKKIIDPKVKKLDIMFKLGTVLILLAGLLFAFNSDVSGPTRTIISFVFGLIYVFVSRYLKELKIEESSKLYWLLGMIFFALSFLSIGYIELFGNWFSLYGEGAVVFIGSCFTVIALLSFLTYFYFENDVYLFGFYGGLLGSIIATLRYLGFNVEEVLVIILPIFLFLSFFSKNTKIFKSRVLFDFTNISVVSSILLFFANMFNMENRIAVYLLTIFFISYIFIMIKRNSKSDLKYFGSILSYCVFIPSIITKDTTPETFALATAIFGAFSYAFSFLYKNKTIASSALTTANVLIILSFILSTLGNEIFTLVIALLGTVISALVYLTDTKLQYETKFELYSHPIKIAMLVYAVILVIGIPYLEIYEHFLAITFAINVLAYCWVKTKEMSSIYSVTSMIMLALNLLMIGSFTSITMILLSLASAFVYYAYSNWVKKDERSKIMIIYLALLLFIYMAAYSLDSALHYFGESTYIYANVVTALLYMAIAAFHKQDNSKYNIALLVTIVPLLSLLDLIENIELAKIVFSLVILYFTFVLSRFVRDIKLKEAVKYIGLLVALIAVIFDTGYLTLVYLLIAAITLMIVGYYKVGMDALFKVGVASLIISLIYRFKSQIFGGPAYVYLLIAGLALIIFVTVKQLRYDDKLKNKKDK